MIARIKMKLFLQLGYSYFNLNDYSNASKYLKNYFDLKENKFTPKDTILY